MHAILARKNGLDLLSRFTQGFRIAAFPLGSFTNPIKILLHGKYTVPPHFLW